MLQHYPFLGSEIGGQSGSSTRATSKGALSETVAAALAAGNEGVGMSRGLDMRVKIHITGQVRRASGVSNRVNIEMNSSVYRFICGPSMHHITSEDNEIPSAERYLVLNQYAVCIIGTIVKLRALKA